MSIWILVSSILSALFFYLANSAVFDQSASIQRVFYLATALAALAGFGAIDAYETKGAQEAAASSTQRER